ncbi:copper resistance CopC family protein [Planotetraspora kaengkrachanensis]|uniref:CopC domain-containing protein n=1 Tax=Planotetraspora kaengkrachanensis TaxID=575193 RepID=A0A8J3VC88_9ACTN|nr:copper resistance protein CopC [Planotetraspora kaengkrachanensis]GIG84598.1 hypothetical protein Pka01_77250 [Planotetraspora kaengkrachanensis]
MSRLTRSSPAPSATTTGTASRRLRRLSLVLLTALLSAAALTTLSSPASAHGQLGMANPAKDSTVRDPLEAVFLYFTEPPAPNSYFTVTTPSGVRVDRQWLTDEPKRLDEPVREDHLIDGVWEPKLYHTGYPAKIPVAYWPEQGVYTAKYMTIASDGEHVQGEVRFTYKGRMTAAPKNWQAPANQPDAALLAATGSGVAAGPQAGGTTSPTPAAGCTPRGVPETGCDTGAPSPAVAAQAAAEDDSGTGVLVWLIPAVLVVAAGFMVVRAARRPSPDGASPARRVPGPPGRSPLAQRTDAPRSASGTKAAKAAKRR